MNAIPSFIDSRRLTIVRAQTTEKDGTTQQVSAADPQGDTITLTKWTEDTGNCMVVPDSTLSVTYQEKDKEPIKHEHVGGDEAYDLYRALNRAERDKDVDPMTVMYLIADLGTRGGGGGGACSL